MDITKTTSLILIDDSNIYYGFQKLNWSLDYEKFYNWVNDNFSVLDVYFFGGIISKKAYSDMHPTHTLAEFINYNNNRNRFLRFLRKTGYKVRTKPVSSLYDNTKGIYTRKCNFDVEITLIALDGLNNYDELVLCSGDGDFTKLLRHLKGKHKKTTLIAHKDRINWELKKTANRVIFIEDLRIAVEREQNN